MGRRKSKRGPGPKKRREPLDAIFDCPFCNHEKSCEVNMDKGKQGLLLKTFQSWQKIEIHLQSYMSYK